MMPLTSHCFDAASRTTPLRLVAVQQRKSKPPPFQAGGGVGKESTTLSLLQKISHQLWLVYVSEFSLPWLTNCNHGLDSVVETNSPCQSLCGARADCNIYISLGFLAIS